MRRGTAHRVGLAAVTTIAVCLGGAAPAVASTGAHVKPVKDPLAGVRKKALADVTVYGKRLTVMLRSGATSPSLGDDERLALHDAGVSEGVALRDDRVAVNRAATKKGILAAVASAQRTVAVASLQLLVSTAAESHLSAAGPVGDAAAALADQATSAAADGSDTTEVTDALDALAVDLESAQGDELTAVDDVVALSPTTSAAGLRAASVTAAEDLALVDQDVSDAVDDLATAQAAYDELPPADPTNP